MGVDDILAEEFPATVNEKQRQNGAGQKEPQVKLDAGTVPVAGLTSILSMEKTDLMFLMLVAQTGLLAYIALKL